MFQTRFLSLAILGGQRVSLRMDSRKPLSNISNNVCCRSVIVGETFPSSKDGIFCGKNEGTLCVDEEYESLYNSQSCRNHDKKQTEFEMDNEEYGRVTHYLKLVVGAKSNADVVEGGSLNRTTSQFSWPNSVISKSKRKKTLKRRTTDGKQILYKAYEKPNTLMIPEGFTTWRHFV
ncbi:uncharacterized protein Gasu_62390 [Galdieria sulphuraria]|uniref:Uncharacterized protein n=1 Tax=Galdieria sulphuraria TaxID=130081 RepID=M2X8D8_GALSU|nr:uncharacterized protein Gasu_62390 [Galdieria sulphuraria]EME26112.1 hypothetical protein Gasu_62390 [Galdieria sulphuraria]|eukprot:XP_005702632.1 hypothetical protein Gasu_62390 [Galdieria sulphuraria]